MPPMPLMQWMRVAIGVGAAGLLAGVFGMVAWIDDGSHYFEVAVAVGSAGFLTLVACVLTQVFGSSHGSQDDAFRRGKSMGYDEGFLAGRRTARPVVVPMPFATRATQPLTSDDEPEPEIPVTNINRISHRLESAVSSISQFTSISHRPEIATDAETVDAVTVDAEKPLLAIAPKRGRHTRSLMPPGTGQRAVQWVRARRTPLAGGALCLLMVGVLGASAFVDVPMPAADASNSASGAQSNEAEPPAGTGGTGGWSTHSADPAIPGATVFGHPGAGLPGAGLPGAVVPGAAVAQISPLAPGTPGAVPAAATFDANGNVVPVPASVRALGATPLTPAVYLPATHLAAVYTPAMTPAVAPAAPAVPLTAAEQTAKNAADAAALTKANAARDAALTAANASEAARVSAADAKAAAAATAKTAECATRGVVC